MNLLFCKPSQIEEIHVLSFVATSEIFKIIIPLNDLVYIVPIICYANLSIIRPSLA